MISSVGGMCLINCGLCIKFALKTLCQPLCFARVCYCVIVIVDPLTNVLSSDILKNEAAKSRQTAKPVTFQFQTRKWTSLACIYA